MHRSQPDLESVLSKPADALLTIEETATVLGLSRSCLAKWRCTGSVKLPFRKLGKAVRYVKADVLSFDQAGR